MDGLGEQIRLLFSELTDYQLGALVIFALFVFVALRISKNRRKRRERAGRLGRHPRYRGEDGGHSMSTKENDFAEAFGSDYDNMDSADGGDGGD